MKREPINPDDPELTAYMLGELTLSERVEFENRLQHSPLARQELESLEEMMSLLSTGLRKEWQTGMKEPQLELLPSIPQERPITKTRLLTRRQRYSVAAVAAAVAATLIATGSGLLNFSGQRSMEVAASANTEVLHDQFAQGSVSISIPQLLLTEELDHVPGVDLATALENVQIDTSYLDQQQEQAPVKTLVAQALSPATSPVDSYLPPFKGAETIEQSAILDLKSDKTFSVGDSINSMVLIRGYVPMGPTSHTGSSKVLAGFQPVAISGNPVSSQESRVGLSELRALRHEINLLMDASTSITERERLQSLLQRSERIEQALKSQ